MMTNLNNIRLRRRRRRWRCYLNYLKAIRYRLVMRKRLGMGCSRMKY
jgi:hypothetical protein